MVSHGICSDTGCHPSGAETLPQEPSHAHTEPKASCPKVKQGQANLFKHNILGLHNSKTEIWDRNTLTKTNTKFCSTKTSTKKLHFLSTKQNNKPMVSQGNSRDIGPHPLGAETLPREQTHALQNQRHHAQRSHNAELTNWKFNVP